MGYGDRVPIDKVYEVLPVLLPGFSFEVCDRSEMGTDHGLTLPERYLIKLRVDVYEGMCKGNGRDRFTGAHELGHLFLHHSAGFARRQYESGLPAYRYNSEWQANSFASAFLIDGSRLVTCRSLADVTSKFGVSESAARVRFRK